MFIGSIFLTVLVVYRLTDFSRDGPPDGADDVSH